MKTLLFLCFWISIEAIGQSEVVSKVVSVIDGNTVEITTEGKEVMRVVLAGIDCPELTQNYGDDAKRELEKMLLKKEVKVTLKGKDRWGNYIAIVMKGSKDPRIVLLEQGLAWTAERNPIPELEEVRLKAQSASKGLWKEGNPTPPWTFRRQQTMMQAKGR